MFTNGRLINWRVAARLANLENLTPAISVKGLSEHTDERRGNVQSGFSAPGELMSR